LSSFPVIFHRSELPDAPMKPETGTRVEEYCADLNEQKLPPMQQERTRANGLLEFAKASFWAVPVGTQMCWVVNSICEYS